MVQIETLLTGYGVDPAVTARVGPGHDKCEARCSDGSGLHCW